MLLLSCAACALAQAADERSYPEQVLQDASHVLSAPGRWQATEWRTAGYATLSVAATMALLDRPLREEMRHHQGSGEPFMRNVERFGAEYSLLALGGFYAAGLASEDANARAVAEDGLAASLIASGVITPSLKLVFGRSRPAQNQGIARFRPFSGASSFPSGHTTQAFAVAGVIAAHYPDSWTQTTAYGIAALVGGARMLHDAHFASDVLAGAWIGTAVGKAVVARHTAQRNNTALLPWSPHGGMGITYRTAF